jgi:ketosteroid isomerase-like protein
MSPRGLIFALLCCLPWSASARDAESEIVAMEAKWTASMLANDVRRMQSLLATDWVLLESNGGVLTRDRFLATIASGDLVHTKMTLDRPTIRIYGDTAIVSGLATSSGTYRGQPFSLHERSSDVFVRHGGRWECVLTQLTAVAGDGF